MNRDLFIQQLSTKILPFWLDQLDHQAGGFIGKVDENLVPDGTFAKSGVMHSRYLWAFSASYDRLKDPLLKEAADHAFDFISKVLWDKRHGGIYWSVTADGQPTNPLKHLYSQAFAIYGLSEYYLTCQEPLALSLAIELFHLVEAKAFEPELGGYHEEFTQDWQPVTSSQVTADLKTIRFTTNSHLHLLEAYSNLYQVWPDDQLQAKIGFLQQLFSEKIYHPAGYFHQYFNANWQPLTTGLSFGHDIESAWLLDRSLDVLGIDLPSLRAITQQVADYQLNHGLDKGAMNNQTDFQTLDQTKVWWVQAEAIIGFYNAYEKTGESAYLAAVHSIWDYVQTYFIDPRPHSEWFGYLVDEQPLKANISDDWKGPYHTVRMYLELIKRMEDH